MLYEESIVMREIFKSLNLPVKSEILDLGSSTIKFRIKAQPFVEENIFIPLKRRGFKITHADIKKGKGVDLILNPEKEADIKDRFDLIICANLLEHVKNVKAVAENIIKLAKEEGYAWVSVPYEYPYHADPIDTMFRPTNNELERLFPKQTFLKSEILNCEKGKVSVIFIKINKDKIRGT